MESTAASAPSSARTADGRVPGRRGRATRQRLLDETANLLGEGSFLDVKVADIARRAGTSPATFYQYFSDVDGAVLDLVEGFVEAGSERLRALVTGPAWSGPDAAAGLAGGFLDFFDEHDAILRAIDIATAEGDERFHVLRVRLLNGVFRALEELATTARADGRLADGLDPGAAAGVLTTMLAHVSAHRAGFETWGVRREALAETMATLIDWTVRSHVK